ncbi:membrane bound O-acyl transferase family-domain-containing protein [Thelephora terrestris]|uniref:Membrane bound O-acyl transferase family-domain-containing protein n=1 Tax=Thelephora terrestris TaxID=56493 RepID=A0A9P6L379_9AGAM|nr:membrane bound O-acyl transferase family-domain-containing protein [Thelephora terrestris]
MERSSLAKILLFEILRVIALYPTGNLVYRLVIYAATTYVMAELFLTPDITDLGPTANSLGNRIAVHFGFITYLLFVEGSFPDHWRRVRDEDHAKESSDNLPSRLPLMKKLWWMLDIAYSLRLVGWVQEPRDCLPPHPPPLRRRFLLKTSLKLIMNIVLLDILTLLTAQNHAFDSRLHDPTDGPETYLAAVPLLHRVPYVLGYAFSIERGAAAFMNVVHLVCVGLGRSSPTLWLDIWGSWGDAYTVRKLWGRTWHQTLRPMVSGFGKLVANKLLKFPRGTNRSSYTQLYIAFFLSAILHFGGEYMCERRMVYRSFKFFLLQAVAITFEDFVIFIGKRLLLQRGIKIDPGNYRNSWAEVILRVAGYFWVGFWFCLTLPIWSDEASAIGLHVKNRGSIAQFLVDAGKSWT